jgi:3-oxoacyl-[acyl-carrier protein] reductase
VRVLITGAGGGLGQALTAAFRNSRAELFLTGRRDFDFLEPDAPGRLIAAVRKRWDSLDVLVNNAAILGPAGPAWENGWPEWESTIRLNLLVPVQLCRGLIPLLRRGGSIINISGGGAASPRANFSAYATAKSGLVRFSETLAVEAAPLGIRVNCIAPGIMRTRMAEAVVRQGADRTGPGEFQKARQVFTEGGTPPETAAELAVMLASERCSGITGKLISAVWDPWQDLPARADQLAASDIYTVRRIVPEDRQ